jgi:membrane-associated protein
MGILTQIVDIILHVDVHLQAIILQYGVWTYGLLFLIIFVETGLVVTPFLPGDSLIFAAAALAAANGSLSIWLLFVLLAAAAVLGDTANYWIGHAIGERAYNIKWIKREYLERTQHFFDKYGRKTIFLARFVPIVRTFAPFVAGIGQMSYPAFISYNIFGGIVWVALFCLAGFLFGNMAFVKHNFSLVVIAIVLISVVPMVIEAVKAQREGKPAEPKVVETP